MAPDERWTRVKALFSEAVGLDPDRREALFAHRCPDDPSLLEEVRTLLQSYEAAGDFIEIPASAVAIPRGAVPGRAPGRLIGPYRLEAEIGHGGMGTVHLASRADGAFERRVAVKIVRRGLDTDEIVERFRHERQTLASLDHPNVARLIDGGTTDEGLPYFVMEFVEGVPIDEYCDERRLTIVQRLEIFLTVCAAVQAAHQNLIVHRDIKPDNILVTADGVPKLLDFGIAKVLGASGASGPRTREAERLMTPEYASPEQILGRPITTATDVYSLGVLLYELLTGRRPRRAAAADDRSTGRAFPEGADDRPSAVVVRPTEVHGPDAETRSIDPEAVSRARQASPAGLRRMLAGDLDTIVATAMRLDPGRRYGSVERLAEDIRRHLAGLPVLARRDTLGYRTAKFVARHAAGVTAMAALIVVLVAGIAGIVWQAGLAAEQRDRARIGEEKARQISAFLQEMLRSPDPRNEGRRVTVVEALDRAAGRLDSETLSHPDVRAALRRAIGVTYGSLGMYDAAERQLRAALAVLPAGDPGMRRERAALETDLADVVSARGELDDAERLYRSALSAYDAIGARDDLRRADALNGLGQVLRQRGDDRGAEAQYREALATRRRLLGDGDEAIAESLNNLAVVHHGRNDLVEAERLYRESLRILRAGRAGDHPGVPSTLANLATLVGSRGDLAAAEPLYREALAIQRRVLGDDHPDVAFIAYSYADTLHALGRYAEAIALCRDVLARRGRSLPERHPVVAASLLILGKSLLEEVDLRGAEAALREALALRRSALPAGHWQTASAQSALGLCLARQGRFREAEVLLVQAYEQLEADRGPRHERTRDALANVVRLYEAWKRPARADAYRARQAS